MGGSSERKSLVQLRIDHLSTFFLAAQQNAYPLLRSITLQYPASDNEQPDTHYPQKFAFKAHL